MTATTTAAEYAPEDLNINDTLALIAAASSPQMVDRVISDCIAAHTRTIREIARRGLRKYVGSNPSREDLDDCASRVAVVAADLLRAGRTDRGAAIENFWGLVQYSSRTEIKKWTESGEFTGIAGATNVRRRQQSMAVDRNRLRDELGREPRDAEVAASYNSRTLQSRTDAARQGAVSTDPRDFVAVAAAPMADMPELPVSVTVDEAPLFTTEARAFIPELLAAAWSASERQGRLATTRYGGYLDPDPVVLTVRECADVLGWDYNATSKVAAKVNLLARDILAEQFGILSADPV